MAIRQADPDVKRLWEQLEDEEEAIAIERRRLQDVWKKISAMHKANAEARQIHVKEASLDFICGDDRVLLNVGGQMFETTAGVLCRDRYSLLAFLCKTESCISKDANGAFFFDRDWWIFRFILQFLRTGDLPQDPALLREMYDESPFYGLNSLRRAIQRRVALAAGIGNIPDRVWSRFAPESQRRSVETLAAQRGPSINQTTQTGSLFRSILPDPYGFCKR